MNVYADENGRYKFNPELAYGEIKAHWTEWAEKVGAKKWVVGISGGKDSTVVAALAAKIFGPENVIGVTLPCGEQSDIADSYAVIEHCKICHQQLNIKEAYYSICKQVLEMKAEPLSDVARVNLAPRLRTAALYAVAQNFDAIVLNTSNLTEDVLGYATLWGDTCGSYAPIHNLTVTEVIELGKWLGLPAYLVDKAPADGLQAQTDEERLGLKYADVDKYIRNADPGISEDCIRKIESYYQRNVFKVDMVRLPGPEFNSLPYRFPKYKMGLE